MADNLAHSLYGLAANELRELILVLCLDPKTKEAATAHIEVMLGASAPSNGPPAQPEAAQPLPAEVTVIDPSSPSPKLASPQVKIEPEPELEPRIKTEPELEPAMEERISSRSPNPASPKPKIEPELEPEPEIMIKSEPEPEMEDRIPSRSLDLAFEELDIKSEPKAQQPVLNAVPRTAWEAVWHAYETVRREYPTLQTRPTAPSLVDLLDLPAVRELRNDPERSKDKNDFTIGPPKTLNRNLKAALLQASASATGVACDRCAKHLNIWDACVGAPACAGCIFNGRAYSCTYSIENLVEDLS